MSTTQTLANWAGIEVVPASSASEDWGDSLSAVAARWANGMLVALAVIPSVTHAGTVTLDGRSMESRLVRALPTSRSWGSQAAREVHPALRSAVLQQYLLQNASADASALCAIFDLVQSHFSGLIRLSTEYSLVADDDMGETLLSLNVDTHGLDLDRLIEREIGIRDAIAKDPSLSNAKKYLVLNVV